MGRNEPCHCGSGKKYKKCCLVKDEAQWRASPSQLDISAEQDDSLATGMNLVPPSHPDFLTDPQPFPMNPEISEEENRLVEDWWSAYDELEDPDAIRKHIETFMSHHPELLEHLGINDDAVFDLGNKYRREGRLGDYAAFLIDYAQRFPNVYSESESYYNLDIIAWLISAGKHQEIKAFFGPYISDPSEHVDQLFDLVDLLITKDIIAPLLFLVEKTKEELSSNSEILAGENILVPLHYYKLASYLKEEYTSDDIERFVDQFIAIYQIDNRTGLLSRWTSRFEDTFRPYGRWEYDLKWNKDEMGDLYFSISDNYMRYLCESCGISLISAQYHSGLIYEYGMACMELKKGKKLRLLFDFSKETMDKAIMTITSGFLPIPDPTDCFSLLNSIYYFTHYLEKCNMLDGLDPETVRNTTATFYEDLFPVLSAYSSLTFCFNVFPFWAGAKNDKKSGSVSGA
ncbi:MAG: SEC-C metal-binding domain-containing protein [Cyclobacteriaceae bacterium]